MLHTEIEGMMPLSVIKIDFKYSLKTLVVASVFGENWPSRFSDKGIDDAGNRPLEHECIFS